MASIPQGDPFSMMLIALLLRPWVLKMRSLAAFPRVLADDIQLLATGPKHFETFEYAFSKTHTNLDDMGAQLAPTKCIVHSSDKVVSKYMQTSDGEELGRR